MEDLELDLGLPNNNANPTQVDNGKKTPQINISADFLGNSLETRTGIIVDPAGVAFSGNNTPMTQGVTGGSAAVGKRIEAIAASKDPNNGRPIDVNGKPVTSIIGEGSTSRAIFNNNPLLKAQDVKIIHAVGPKFDGDEKKFQETLTQTLKDTIKVWKDTPALQNEPLNFPLISGGNFRGNLDPNRYCEILLESLENAISDSNLSADQVAKISIAPYSKEEYTNLKKAVETNLTKSTQNTVTENLSATITPESPTNTNSPTLNPATTNNPADTANPKVGEALDILDQKGVDPKEALQKVYEEKIKIGTNRVNNFKNIESQLQKDKFLAADLDTFLKGLDKGKEEDTSLDAFNRLLTATLASNKTDDEKGAFIKDAVAKFSFLGNPVANKETEANNLLTAFTSLAVANPTFADIVEVEKKKYTDDLTEAMVKNVDAGLVADTPSTTTPAPVTTDPIKTKVDPNTKEKVDTGVAVAKGVTTVTLVATSAAFFPPIGVLLVVAAGAYFMNRGKGKEKKEAEEAAKLAAEQAAYDADPDNALSAAEFSKMVDERNATKKAALANIGEGGPDNEKGGAGQQSKDEKNADGKKPQPLDPSKKGEKDKNTNPDEEIFRKSGEEETEKGAKDRTIVEDLGGEKDFEKKAAETKAMLEAQKLTEQQTAENIEQNEGAGKGEALQNLTIVTESEIKQDLAETVNILHDAKDTLDKAGGKNQTQQQATKEAPTLNSVTTDVVTPQTTTAIKEGTLDNKADSDYMDISPDSERDEQNGNYLEVFPNDNTETSSTNKAANLSDAVFEESQENLTIKVATKLSSAIKAAQNVPIEEQNSMDTTEEKKSEIGKSNNSWINRIEQNAVNPNEKGQRS